MFMAEDNVHAGSLNAFPAGLRVLLVDDDLNCLSSVARLLQACRYQVTTCRRGTDALSLLRENERKFDIIISDLYMPDMDGFQLLEAIQLEIDVPVVIMSNDGSKEVVMKVIIMGACDYLVKPVRKEEISVIWQHVVRKHKNESKSFMVSEINQSGEEYRNKSSPDEENCGSSNHVKNDEDEPKNDIVSLKKQRMVWTTELHEQFVAAVNEIGLKNAVPKKILELMKVPGLTRENVASHLQKYRIYLRRKTENIGKRFCNPSAQIQNVMHPYMVGSSTSQAYAVSNDQLQSRGSVVSQAEIEPERLSIVASGHPITQGNYYNQPWCYGLQVNLPPHHGTSHTAIEPEQDDFTTMQREQALNDNGTMHFSVPIPSLIVDVAQNDQGYNLSSYDCSPAGTDQNTSFATVGNSQSEYTFSCSGYDSVFLVQHYNQEDLTES